MKEYRNQRSSHCENDCVPVVVFDSMQSRDPSSNFEVLRTLYIESSINHQSSLYIETELYMEMSTTDDGV